MTRSAICFFALALVMLAVDKADASGADYSLVLSPKGSPLTGGIDCPSESGPMWYLDECKLAAKSNEVTSRGIQREWNFEYNEVNDCFMKPTGCFVYVDGAEGEQIFFNHCPSSTGFLLKYGDKGDKGKGKAERICKTWKTPNPTPGPTASTPGPTASTPGPTASTPGPTASTPGPTASAPTQGPTTTSPTSSPTLDPVSVAVSVAATAFDKVVDYFAKLGPDHCYTNTGAANVDMKELKSKFASYKKHVRKMTFVGRMALRNDFQKRQSIFAAAKRNLRTLKRKAKLNGKKGCDTGSPV